MSLISSNMSRESLLAWPSVPSPTFTPALSISSTLATPTPSLEFDLGQCMTLAPLEPRVLISSAVR
jgi:hypothetical protein